MNPSLQVSLCLSFLLCQEKGWHAASGPGLPQAQRDDDQELLPASPHLGAHRQTSRSQILHEVRHSLGIQQCPDPKRRRGESRLPHKPGPVRAHHHVLRLTNSPTTFQWMMNDIFRDPDRRGESNHLPRRHPDFHEGQGGTPPNHETGSPMPMGEQAFPQSGEV